MTGKIVLCAASLAFSGVASADAQTATQRVTFYVAPLNKVAVSANPASLVIAAATPGNAPSPVTTSGGTYAITTNEHGQKITAAIDESMPAGMTLELAMSAPAGSSSLGLVVLTTSAADVVTGIDAIAADALPITYRLSATASVSMPVTQARVVTFTIIAAP